jgi:ankyrin repeat protein
VLDALYAAGADISLFTTAEHYTPLHVLALSARRPASLTPGEYGQILNAFAKHLIRDLHAPLSAKDREDETCIHIAAEKGKYVDLLIAFLECDSTAQVRKMRNSRG